MQHNKGFSSMVLIFIIVLALIAGGTALYLTNKTPILIDTNVATQVPPADDSNLSIDDKSTNKVAVSPCDLDVQTNQVVSFPLTVSGQMYIGAAPSTFSCPLGVFEGQVGTAQAESTTGTTLGLPVGLMVTEKNFDYQMGVHQFAGTITLTAPAKSGETIVLRFTKEDPSGATPISFTISVIAK